MKLYDISVAISPGRTPVYPGDPGVEIVSWASIARGDAANVSFLRFGAHTATHVDAPAHFIEGAPGLPQLPLEIFIGAARVFEVAEDVRAIGRAHVEAAGIPAGTERVLFKTRNSTFWGGPRGGDFREDFTYLTPEAARTLVELNVKLVGMDYLSVEQFKSADFETHLTLLGRGIVLLEGLNLSGVPPGDYELICLPLKLEGGSGDGSPARAVLRALG
ncbi:MAG: cyclase family protein [Pyrinomonadaceae bacterium]